MKLIFIRHTRVNVSPGICYGQTDVPLADSFLKEAEEVRQKLSLYGAFHEVYTSPLKRATKLAEFCGYTDALPDARLMEMNMGEWEMQKYDDIQDPWLQEWYKDYLHLPTTGGESFPQLRARVAEFIDERRQNSPEDATIAVFAHAGVLIAAMLYTNLFPESEAFRNQPQYGGIIELVF